MDWTADCKKVSKQTADIQLIRNQQKSEIKSAGEVEKLLSYSTADCQLSAKSK